MQGYNNSLAPNNRPIAQRPYSESAQQNQQQQQEQQQQNSHFIGRDARVQKPTCGPPNFCKSKYINPSVDPITFFTFRRP